MKITIDELNAAYLKANEFKRDGYPTRRSVKIELERNPMIHQEHFDDESELQASFKLEFRLNKDLGPKGSYVLYTDVEVIDDEC